MSNLINKFKYKYFHVIFTCLSSDVLLRDKYDRGIIDSCEKYFVVPDNYLTNKQYSIITNYVYDIACLIAVQQFDKIFSRNQQCDKTLNG
ncbi:unnamed protein product [Rotaria sp. Silwood2]|nr:unnamed protein product [Rotaria sp. Silwood2]CAF4208129.1 unnamed protein product [Rotaria sp. Silwood2]CAF4549402.1 unnamed protein product [Rotaria sp. Silwood2]